MGAVLTFDDGRTFEVPSSWGYPTGAHVAGLDANGRPVGRDRDIGFYALSPCCGASDKGGEHGIVCRACHRPFEDSFVATPVSPLPLDPAKGLELLVEHLPVPLVPSWHGGGVREGLGSFAGIQLWCCETAWIDVAETREAAEGAELVDEDWTRVASCDLTSRASIETAIMRIRLNELLVRYEPSDGMTRSDDPAGLRGSDDELLHGSPWVAIQHSTRDSRMWLSLHGSPQDVGAYDWDAESSGDWYLEDVVNLTNGRSYEIVARFDARPKPKAKG